MRGFPSDLRTKQDYVNAVMYVKKNPEGRAVLLARLEQMKSSTARMELKESAREKPADKQHQEDYEAVPDPCCEMRRLGFTKEELDCLIGGIKACFNG